MEKKTWKCYLGAPAGHLGMQNTSVNANYGTLGDDTSATFGICSYIQRQQSASVGVGTQQSGTMMYLESQCYRFNRSLILRVQVPNYHILTQNLYCNYYYPQVPNYWVIGPSDSALLASLSMPREIRTNCFDIT